MNPYQNEYDDSEYEEELDSMYGSVEICGHDYSAGYALRQIDEDLFDSMRQEYEDEGSWFCNECGEGYDSYDDAEECCAEDEDEDEDEDIIEVPNTTTNIEANYFLKDFS